MKGKLFTTMMLLCMFTVSKAQITLENTYNPPDLISIPIIKLSLSGDKFVSIYQNYYKIDYFKLYNSDHSLFKTIQVPVIPGPWNAHTIGSISETLFNLDSLVEYIIQYVDTSGNQAGYRVYVYDENGTVLLSVQDGYLNNNNFTANPYIVSMGNSTKLILPIKPPGPSQPYTSVQVYSLPGHLTCFDCNNGIVSSINGPNDGLVQRPSSMVYPNPSAGQAKIKYTLPANYHKASIEIFDLSGNFLKSMNIDNRFDEIILSNEDLPSGVYLYSIIVDNKVTVRNKFVITK